MSPTPLTRRWRAVLFGRGTVARVLAALLAVMQLGGAALAPVADAVGGHHEQVVLHIEDADGGDCPASHGEADCTLCQLAHGARAVLPTSPALAAASIRASASCVPGALGVAAAPRFLDGRSSRAPPLG